MEENSKTTHPYPKMIMELYKRDSDHTPYTIFPKARDFTPPIPKLPFYHLTYDQIIEILLREFPLTNFSSDILIRYVHPEYKSYFLLKTKDVLNPNEFRRHKIVLMLNIPRWNDVNKKNKRWHRMNKKIDVGLLSKRVDKIEEVVEKIRISFFALLRYGFLNDQAEFSIRNKTFSKEEFSPKELGGKSEGGDSRRRIRPRKDTGIEEILDLERRSLSLEKNSDEGRKKERMKERSVNFEKILEKDRTGLSELEDRESVVAGKLFMGKQLLQILHGLYSKEEIKQLKEDIDNISKGSPPAPTYSYRKSSGKKIGNKLKKCGSQDEIVFSESKKSEELNISRTKSFMEKELDHDTKSFLLAPSFLSKTQSANFSLAPLTLSSSPFGKKYQNSGGKKNLHNLENLSGDRKHDTHIAVLYSSPLVVKTFVKNKINIKTMMNDPVDYAGECSAILKILTSHKKKMNIHLECATADKLTKLINKKPKILHISCHGDYDKELKQYFLEFENHSAELYKLTPEVIKRIFKGQDLSGIKLMFVNACHSESVARAFLKLGVSCIIVVEGRAKIDDTYAKEFSSFFYGELLDQRTINTAFNNAKMQLQAAHIYSPSSCCCGHEHKDSCIWYKAAQKKGINETHFSHVACCNCPKADNHIHLIDCSWADYFQLEYDAKFEILENGKEMFVCCCSPELPHNEVNKLKLIYKEDDTTLGDIVLFNRLKSGRIFQSNKHYFGEDKFKNCSVLGQNKVIYKMYNDLVQYGIRIIYLKGERGCGKSSISKYLGNYLRQRHKVGDIKYFNMQNISSVHVFVSKIPGYGNDSFVEVNYNKYDKEPTLMILDNMDILLKNHFKKFKEKMNDILEVTNLKFIILTQNANFLNKDSDQNSGIMKFQKIYSVPYLTSRISAKMLISMAKDYLPFLLRNVTNLEKHAIFKYCKTPIQVGQLSLLLRKGKQPDDILEIYMEKKNTKFVDETEKIQEDMDIASAKVIQGNIVETFEPEKIAKYEVFLEQLKMIDSRLFDLINFISTFTSGVLLTDIIDYFKFDVRETFKLVIVLSSLCNMENFEYDDVEFYDDCERILEFVENGGKFLSKNNYVGTNSVEDSDSDEEDIDNKSTKTAPGKSLNTLFEKTELIEKKEILLELLSTFIANKALESTTGSLISLNSTKKLSEIEEEEYEADELTSISDNKSKSKGGQSDIAKNSREIPSPILDISSLKPHLPKSPIVLKSNPILRLITPKPESLVFWQLLASMQYFCGFYSSVLHKIKSSKTYMENLVENSVMNSSVVWSGGIRMNPKNYCYFIDKRVGFDEIDELIKFHEVNIRSLLTDENGIYSFYNSFRVLKEGTVEKQYEDTFIGLIEKLIFQILTLHKINGNYDSNLEYVSYIRNLYRTEAMQNKLKVLDAKVELHVADIYLNRLKSLRKKELKKVNFGEIFEQLSLVNEITENFDESDLLILRSEYLLTRYEIIFTMWLRRQKKSRDKSLKAQLPKIIEDLLFIKSLLDEKKNEFIFILGKVNLRIILHNYHNGLMDLSEIDGLKNCLKVFKKCNSLKLAARTLHLLSLIHKKNAEVCLKWSKSGLEIAEKACEKKMIKQFKDLISESNSEIRYRYQNKFIFLSCNPLNIGKGFNPKHAGLNLEENLRELLWSDMKEYGKNILVHFDLLNRKFLDEIFKKNKGCKLLVIDNRYTISNGIVIEGPGMTKEEVTYEGLEETENKISVDIFISLGENSKKLVKFMNKRGAKLCIHFNFEEQSHHFTDLLSTYSQNMFKYIWLKKFVSLIVNNCSVLDAIENAKRETAEILAHQLRTDYKLLEVRVSSYRTNSDLTDFPPFETIFEKCVQVVKSQDYKDTALNLADGKMEDTSTIEFENLSHFKKHFVKRSRETVKVFNLVQEHKLVNIYGERGTGKSDFVTQLKNELILRNIYSDGVFLFKLGRLYKNWLRSKEFESVFDEDHRDKEKHGSFKSRSKATLLMKRISDSDNQLSLKELMKDQFGKRFEHNMISFFKEKKMLIILDDFDLVAPHDPKDASVSKKSLFRYPTFLFNTLKENNIHLITVTHKSQEKLFPFEKPTAFNMPNLNFEQSLILLLALPDKLFIRFKKLNLPSLYDSGTLVKCSGNPRKLYGMAKHFLQNELKFKKFEGAIHTGAGANMSELFSGSGESAENKDHRIHQFGKFGQMLPPNVAVDLNWMDQSEIAGIQSPGLTYDMGDYPQLNIAKNESMFELRDSIRSPTEVELRKSESMRVDPGSDQEKKKKKKKKKKRKKVDKTKMKKNWGVKKLKKNN